jgi:hypothetical protein
MRTTITRAPRTRRTAIRNQSPVPCFIALRFMMCSRCDQSDTQPTPAATKRKRKFCNAESTGFTARLPHANSITHMNLDVAAPRAHASCRASAGKITRCERTQPPSNVQFSRCSSRCIRPDSGVRSGPGNRQGRKSGGLKHPPLRGNGKGKLRRVLDADV